MRKEMAMGHAFQTNADRRSMLRQRSFKGAVLQFNRGYSSLDAVVRNFSGQGAMLSMGDTSGIPSRFEIRISGEETRMATIRWRSPVRAGIQFEN
ncbi:hypothetical protein ACLB6G_17225 [Zhengella sp. ZM62]|uniref:hypothetical protein n=1 Tax=Zhengella sedimenti TaxID=3390035 RepID=UPI003975381A